MQCKLQFSPLNKRLAHLYHKMHTVKLMGELGRLKSGLHSLHLRGVFTPLLAGLNDQRTRVVR